MEAVHQELWKRIHEFPFESPGEELSFTGRLAQENGWDLAYARRVGEEYRRFMFLASAAGHLVTPSDAVDQAWHLHLTYTRSYDRFCSATLGKRIHHEPTRGGLREEVKFARAYEKTLESYRSFFGQQPPPDIWPDGRERFGAESRCRRVNVGRYLLLSKVHLVLGGAVLTMAASGLAVVLTGENALPAFERAMDLRGPEFLGFYLLVFLAVLTGGLAFRRIQRAPNDDPSARELDLHPYEIAYLSGGAKRAVAAALAALVDRGVVGVGWVTYRITRNGSPEPEDDPLERALGRAVDPKEGSRVSDLQSAARSALDGIRSKLEDLGLVVSGPRNFLTRMVCVLLVLATVGFGLAKLHVGLERGRPILLLGLEILGSGIAGIAILIRRLERTRRGDRALQRLQHEYRRLSDPRIQLRGDEIPVAAGLFGMDTLAGAPGSALTLLLGATILDDRRSGVGCGNAGCGGGGGGGCGGCGGCGG